MPDAEVSKKRFYGIDLLKALSMLMIVTLHVLGNGGVLGMLEPLTVRYEAAYFLEAMCFCAVNCFGLATGYIMCRTRFSSHRLGALWLEVVWHTFGLTLLFYLFMPGSAGPWQFFTSFFPVTFSYYWYFTAYFGMFFFIPFFLSFCVFRVEIKTDKSEILLRIRIFPQRISASFFCGRTLCTTPS